MNDKQEYHYLLLLLDDLERDSFKFIRHLCKKEIESFDELIDGFSKKIVDIPDEELKDFKQKLVNQKHQQEVMSTLLNTFLDTSFVRKRATDLLTKIKKEEENNK
jgi:glutamyl-tRNA reductase